MNRAWICFQQTKILQTRWLSTDVSRQKNHKSTLRNELAPFENHIQLQIVIPSAPNVFWKPAVHYKQLRSSTQQVDKNQPQR